MSVPTVIQALPPYPPGRRFGPVVPIARLAAFSRLYDRYLQRRALAELDDRMLGDIGLTRRDVEREIRKPYWR